MSRHSLVLNQPSFFNSFKKYPGNLNQVIMSSVETKTASSSHPDQHTPDNDDRKYLRIRHMEQMGFKIEINEEENEVKVCVPGLCFDSFDRDGNPSITGLLSLVSSSQFFAHMKPLDKTGRTHFDYALLTKAGYTFMASFEMDIEKDMYNDEVSKWPMNFKFHLGFIGKSSFNNVGTLSVPPTGHKLLNFIYQLVYINKETRRPTPIPDWWKSKYSSLAGEAEPLIVQKTARPMETCISKVTVKWTHTDNYNHVHWISYVHFCLDALHDAIRKCFYRNINKDVVKRGLRNIRMGFSGENLEGDELVIHTWECVKNGYLACFEIEKAGQVVFHCVFSYTPTTKSVKS